MTSYLRFGTCAPVLAFIVLLSGCASTPLSTSLLDSPPAGLPATVRLAHVPFFSQDQYQCGPAALATVLSASGVSVVPDDLVDRVYVPGQQGSYQLELITAARSHDRLAYRLNPSLQDLLQEVLAGNPVLVLQNLGLTIAPQWHFAVVKGYDLDAEVLILNSGTIEDYALSMALFERTWARGNHWGIVLPEPGKLPATANPADTFAALTELDHSTDESISLNTYYEAAAQRWPDDTTLMMGYGNLMISTGDYMAAEAAFYHVASSYPDYAPAFNNLAYLLYEQERFQEAVNYANRAVELGGDFTENYQETLSLITAQLSAR